MKHHGIGTGRFERSEESCGLVWCNEPAIADAPVSICGRHARLIYEFGRDLVAANTQEKIPDPVILRFSLSNLAAMDPRRYSSGVVVNRMGVSGVYYVLVGDRIKIGRSVDVYARVKHYPPGRELLAVERTDNPRGLEEARLQQFSHCRLAGREWFSQHPDLLAHIKALNA